jgi:hypothetical protein
VTNQGEVMVPFDTYWAMVQECDKMRLDRDEAKGLLSRWLEFAADVQPGCAAGADWLDELRTKTQRMVDA